METVRPDVLEHHSDTEFSMAWIAANPHLFVNSLNAIFERTKGKRLFARTSASGGFLTISTQKEDFA